MTAPKPEAVIDASVWIALSVVGCLDLLPLFFAKVYLPDAVYAEILRGEARVGGSELQQAVGSWLVHTGSVPIAEEIPLTLGAGEREVLSFAMNAVASNKQLIALLDDRLARRWIQQQGIPVMGTVGLLKVARESGVIGDLLPLLEKLSTAGFRIKDDLRYRILRQVGDMHSEQPSL